MIIERQSPPQIVFVHEHERGTIGETPIFVGPVAEQLNHRFDLSLAQIYQFHQMTGSQTVEKSTA